MRYHRCHPPADARITDGFRLDLTKSLRPFYQLVFLIGIRNPRESRLFSYFASRRFYREGQAEEIE